MNLFGKRPLALFCALFAAASVGGCLLTAGNIGIHLPVSGFFALAAILSAMLMFFLPATRARLLTLALACLFVASAFFASWFSVDRKLQRVSGLYETESECELEVEEILKEESYLSVYRVRVLSLGGGKPACRALLSFEYSAGFAVGDTLHGRAVVYRVSRDTDSPAYRLADGIFLSLEASGSGFLPTGHHEPGVISKWFRETREDLAGFFGDLIGGEEGALVCSLLLGKRELLDSATVRDFRRTGTSHLLAISGLHLSVMILLADLLLRGLRVRKQVRCVAVLLFAGFYMALSGFALSTLRAFLMCAFVYFSCLLRSDNDAVTSLSVALFLILAFSPCSVYDIGMWMSFAAVLGILMANELLAALRVRLKKKNGKLSKRARVLLSVLSVTGIAVAAGFFICFPLWLAFDEMSLLSVPSGILLSPLVTLILILAPFTLLFSPISGLAALLGGALRFVCHVLLGAVAWFSSFRGITVSLRRPAFAVLIPLAALVTLVFLVIRLRHKWVFAAAAGAMLLCFGITVGALRLFGGNAVTADFRSLGEDEFLIFTAGEESVICDMTAGGYNSLSEANELSRARYATEIDAFILTHYHSRQISSMSRLLSSATVRRLCLPVPATQSEYGIFSSLLTVAARNRTDILVYDRGTPFTVGNLPLSLTVSPESYLKRSTHPTFWLCAESGGENLVYIAESAHEPAELYTALSLVLPSADAAFFGVHGPVTKSEFSYPLTDIPHVFLSNEGLLPFLRLTETPRGKLVNGTESVTMILAPPS